MLKPSSSWPAIRGGALALLAAILFGISTPLVQRAGVGLGALSTAALLYTGAAFVGLCSLRPPQMEARLARQDLLRLVAMVLFGACIGPVALAWGLQHTSGTSASLMLTLEALFTAVLAWVLYRESMDRRVWVAMALLLAGGLFLVVDQSQAGAAQMVGLLAVLAATAAWGIDNTLSRGLADRDPGQVVLGKAVLGASSTGLLAWWLGEPSPSWVSAAVLLVIGGTGYGLSLRFYLLAQRAFGAARTGSVFAFAPFIGAAMSIALGDRGFSLWMGLGSALMLLGVGVHLVESHGHEHTHEALEHEHAHCHDDGHHDHVHEQMPVSAHSHPHRHREVTHNHEHVPDLHHLHRH